MPRTDRAPRQRLNPAQRRTSIIKAARQAFSREAYDQVAVTSIASQAGASEALLYRYFESKAGLYIAVLKAVFADLIADQTEAVEHLAAEATPKERIAAALAVQLDRLDDEALLLLPGNDPSDATPIRAELRMSQMGALRNLSGLGPKSTYPLIGLLGFLEAICAERRQAPQHAQMRHEEIVEMTVGSLFGAIGDSASTGAAPLRYNKFGNPIY